jgi:hypothetical protein
MKALYRTLIAGYYRRNALSFTLAVLLLAFVFRPPTVLVSPYVIQPMLEDLRFFAGVLTLLLLLQAKAWYETVAALRHPENQFLLALPALSATKLLGQLLRVNVGVMAPALAYGAVIMGYSLAAGTWHVAGLLALQGGVLAVATVHLRRRLLVPDEVSYRSARRSRVWQLGLTYPLGKMLWVKQRRALLTHKAVATLLLVGVAQYHLVQPFSTKGLNLVLLSIAMLQAMLPYWLRQRSDAWLMPWRNLPLSRWRWWASYLMLGGMLFAPEAMLAYAWQLPLWAALSYWLGAVALFMLAVALLHYQALTVKRYLIRSAITYVLPFLGLLYGLPWWGLALGGLAFGTWIFFEEWRKWNGFEA